LTTWRREREAGVRQALAPQKRGPKSKRNPLQDAHDQLLRDHARLTEQLRKAEIVIEVQKKVAALLGWPNRDSRPGAESLMDAVTQLCPTVGIESACDALGVARACFYRLRPMLGPLLTATVSAVVPRPTPARALSQEERLAVRAVLHSTRFQDSAPAAIQA
jgi:alcohol dehydrogenase class IV